VYRFHTHYGRWIRLPVDISVTALLSRTRQSPLLLCSMFLIAVRHTRDDLSDALAPKLFQEATRLVQQAMLIAPQTLEFFQATIILSLWSTTIGQFPMSIDGWLLTSHAIMQASASPIFASITPPSRPNFGTDLDQVYIWNHLCVAHLQYVNS
jgi:hypothetical protein